jgi:predicted carbohydrate-binding protein with CBM5 and CBM33 domain
MRRRAVALPLLSTAAIAASLIVGVQPALAHAYISSPPSRQANCASKALTCGDIQWEPQSVEAPKGSKLCNGGGSRFAELNDTSKPWPVRPVGTTVTFNWTFTARHATSTWEYFIGNTLLASFNDGGAIPGATKSHTVSMGSFRGRQTVLARWNIADTANAFYSCVDVTIGSSLTSTPAASSPALTSSGIPAPWRRI